MALLSPSDSTPGNPTFFCPDFLKTYLLSSKNYGIVISTFSDFLSFGTQPSREKHSQSQLEFPADGV